MTALAFSPGGKTLASVLGDGTVGLWDTTSHQLIATLYLTGVDYGNVRMADIEFSPDGETLAGADTDGTVGLWNTTSHQPIAKLAGHTDAVNVVVFSPDGKTLASTSDDHCLLTGV